MGTSLKTTHGILSTISSVFTLAKSDGTFINFDEPIKTLAQLYDVAIDNQLSHLWIHQNCRIEILQPLSEDFSFKYTWKYDEQIARAMGKNPLVSCFGRRLFRRFEPGIPQRKSWNLFIIFFEHVLWDWPKDSTPQAILAIIDDLERKLGVQMSGSPSGVGLRYLKKIHATKIHWLEKPKTDLAALQWNEAAKPLIWHRQLEESEIAQNNYLLAVDKNAAYPRAAQEERFGVGEPEHHEQIELDARAVDFNVPGLYHVCDVWEETAPATTWMDKGLIPSPMHDKWAGFDVWEKKGWVVAPLLKALVKSGFHVSIDEMWIFPHHEPLFKRWSESLWGLRQACAPESILKDSIKQIMNDTLGLTRSLKFGESLMARPDWNAQVVAGSRANMIYNITKFAKDDHFPVMVQMDALYYLTKWPDPNMSIPGIIDHKNGLGGYKLKWCLPLNDAIANLLLSNIGQAKKLQQLNEMSRHVVESHVW